MQQQKQQQQQQQQGSRPEDEKEIIIDSKPMPDSTLESLKQRLFGTDITTSATFQKIYDVASPLTSPPPTSVTTSVSTERSLSPKISTAQRRVHFADPPAQSVIEIEPRESMKRRERSRDSLPVARRETVGLGSQISRPDTLTVPSRHAPASQKSLSETEVDSQIKEEIYAKYSRLKSDIARETLLSPNRHPPSYTSSIIPGAYASVNSQSAPATSPSGSGGINVSIIHQKADYTSPTAQYSFTLPQAQPGQPSHFRYTISARKPSDPVSFEYSVPPSYEESMRMRSVHQVILARSKKVFG